MNFNMLKIWLMMLALLVYYNLWYTYEIFSTKSCDQYNTDETKIIEQSNTNMVLSQTRYQPMNQFQSVLRKGPLSLVTRSSINIVPNLKNPCFWPMNCSLDTLHHPFCIQNLRCLPYFILIGVEKSGTSYLYWELVKHKFIHGATMKEPHFFDDSRNPLSWTFAVHHGTLDGYAQMFDNSTHPYATGPEAIRKCLQSTNTPVTCEDMITDFTPRYFAPSNTWTSEWFNDGLEVPFTFSAHKIRLLLPDVKLLMIMRDPSKRLFSSYRYFKRIAEQKSQEDFHNRVLGQISSWSACVQRYSERTCLFGSPYDRSFGTFWDLNSFDQLRLGCYILYVHEWRRVFPRNQFHFINFDVYKTSPVNYTRTYVLPFLGVPDYEAETRDLLGQRDEHASSTKVDERHGELAQMWNETRKLLDEFYASFNHRLAQYLQDSSFLWNT